MEVWRVFYILKVYWLSCNDSCAESSSSFKHSKNSFLKRRLTINLRQVMIDVQYSRDWQLGLKKILQDSVVKPIIFTTKEMTFSVNPHIYKMGPRGPKHFIFGDHFYSKNARKLRFHVFLHFNARKHISLFYLKWTEFTGNCEFVLI